MSLFAATLQPADVNTYPSAPAGATGHANTLGPATATDGSAGNVVSRVWYVTQGGVAGTITDTFVYSGASSVNGVEATGTRNAMMASTTGYTVSLSASSETQGVAITVTYTPSGGTWPPGVVLTPVAQTLTGAFSPAVLYPAGSAPITCTFTPSNAATGSISATTVPTMTNVSGGQADTSVAMVTTTITGATIASTGTSITIGLTQSATLASLAAFTLTVGGAAVAVTWTSPGTAATFFTGTLASTVYSGVVCTYSVSATNFTSPAMGATVSGAAITNNSTVAVPAPTVAHSISFAGPAGAPTGNQVLTPWSTATLPGLALDGAGNLIMPNAGGVMGLFQAIGVRGDGTYSVAIPAQNNYGLQVSVRCQTTGSAAGQNGYVLVFISATQFRFAVVTNGAGTYLNNTTASNQLLASGGTTSTLTGNGLSGADRVVSIVVSGNTFTLQLGGSTIGLYTDSTYSAAGYLGVGDSIPSSPEVYISAITAIP